MVKNGFGKFNTWVVLPASFGLSQSFSGWFIPSTLNKEKGDYAKLNGITFNGASSSIRASMSIGGRRSVRNRR